MLTPQSEKGLEADASLSQISLSGMEGSDIVLVEPPQELNESTDALLGLLRDPFVQGPCHRHRPSYSTVTAHFLESPSIIRSKTSLSSQFMLAIVLLNSPGYPHSGEIRERCEKVLRKGLWEEARKELARKNAAFLFRLMEGMAWRDWEAKLFAKFETEGRTLEEEQKCAFLGAILGIDLIFLPGLGSYEIYFEKDLAATIKDDTITLSFRTGFLPLQDRLERMKEIIEASA